MTKSSVKGGAAESYHARKVSYLAQDDEDPSKDKLFFRVHLSTVTRVRNQQWGDRKLQRLIQLEKKAVVSEDQQKLDAIAKKIGNKV